MGIISFLKNISILLLYAVHSHSSPQICVRSVFPSPGFIYQGRTPELSNFGFQQCQIECLKTAGCVYVNFNEKKLQCVLVFDIDGVSYDVLQKANWMYVSRAQMQQSFPTQTNVTGCPSNSKCIQTKVANECKCIPTNHAITEQICQNDIWDHFLVCETGKVLRIVNAIHGRGEDSVCPGPLLHTNCFHNVFSIVHGVCSREQICQLGQVPELLSDPCVGTTKYLEITYNCLTPWPVPSFFDYFRICPSHSGGVGCSNGRKLWIEIVFYETQDFNSLCGSGRYSCQYGNQKTGTNLVRKGCSGKTSCSIYNPGSDGCEIGEYMSMYYACMDY